MTDEKFKVLQFIRELIIRIDVELKNFPKKDIEIKQKIRGNCFDLLEIAYEANTSSNNLRKIELLEKCIAKIKVMDFLLNLSYDNKLITSKKYLKLADKMNDILKYISGWLKKIKANSN